ncbi:hypothetical protein Tco_1341029, partial [Tanacetum coccineum]
RGSSILEDQECWQLAMIGILGAGSKPTISINEGSKRMRVALSLVQMEYNSWQKRSVKGHPW